MAWALDELEQRILPWWVEHGLSDEAPGVRTCFDNRGRLQSTHRFIWSQGRWAWLCARLADAVDSGPLSAACGTAEEWAARGTATAHWLSRYAVLPGGRTAYELTEDGAPVPQGTAGELWTSVLVDQFVALGLAGVARRAGDDALRDMGRDIYLLSARRMREGLAPSEPYPVPEGHRDLAGAMLRLHVGAEVLATLPGDERVTAEVEAAVAELLDGSEGHPPLLMSTDWHEMSPAGGRQDSLVARHRTPGHVLETLWMVLDAAGRVPSLATRDLSLVPSLAVHALTLGWDERDGGLLRYADCDGGMPHGRPGPGDGRYDGLVRETWDTKLWWVHVEAIFAALCIAERWPGCGLEDWAARVTAYTRQTFPDPDGNEWIQIRDRAGRPFDAVVALPVKDPFHIPRALLMVTELKENGGR